MSKTRQKRDLTTSRLRLGGKSLNVLDVLHLELLLARNVLRIAFFYHKTFSFDGPLFTGPSQCCTHQTRGFSSGKGSMDIPHIFVTVL
jgi:hypothetical protein